MTCPTGPITDEELRFSSLEVRHFRRMAEINETYLPDFRGHTKGFVAIGVVSIVGFVTFAVSLAFVSPVSALIALPFLVIAFGAFRDAKNSREYVRNLVEERDCYLARADQLERAAA